MKTLQVGEIMSQTLRPNRRKKNTRKDEEKHKNGTMAIEATHPRRMELREKSSLSATTC